MRSPRPRAGAAPAAPLAVAPLAVATLAACLSSCVISIDGWDLGWGFGEDDPSHWIETTERFAVDATGLRSIRCTTHNGGIDIVGEPSERETRTVRAARDSGDAQNARNAENAESAAEAEVAVEVRKKVGGRSREDAEAAMAALRVERNVSDGQLELGFGWEGEKRPGWRASVAFAIRCPADLEVEAVTHNGHVEIRAIQGAVAATTHNGQVTARGATRWIALETHNGKIDVELERGGRIDGDVETHNGSVRVRLPDDASVRLRCRTHNGGVSSSLALHDVFRGRDFLSGTLGAGAGTLNVKTHNGSVRLR